MRAASLSVVRYEVSLVIKPSPEVPSMVVADYDEYVNWTANIRQRVSRSLKSGGKYRDI